MYNREDESIQHIFFFLKRLALQAKIISNFNFDFNSIQTKNNLKLNTNTSTRISVQWISLVSMPTQSLILCIAVHRHRHHRILHLNRWKLCEDIPSIVLQTNRAFVVPHALLSRQIAKMISLWKSTSFLLSNTQNNVAKQSKQLSRSGWFDRIPKKKGTQEYEWVTLSFTYIL